MSTGDATESAAEINASQTEVRMPFEAASACGLACLLLMLEGSTTAVDLFLIHRWGQVLMAQTAWVRVKV